MLTDKKSARNYAFKLLSMRGYTVHALQEKLRGREYSAAVIEEVIKECISKGYLCDRKWAESFVRVQLKKKYGRNTIEQKLRMKKIAPTLIDDVLGEYIDDVSQVELIKALLHTRYRGKNLADRSDRHKVIASIMRRGFPLPLVLKVISV